MMDFLTSFLAGIVLMLVIWGASRDNPDEHIRSQWKRPYGIIVRLSLVILVLHWVFGVFGVSVALGYLTLVVLTVMCQIPGSGHMGTGILVIGWLIYEWALWFPSRKTVIHIQTSAQPPPKLDLKGKAAYATTRLSPVGKIKTDDFEVMARAEYGSIDAGSAVIITGKNGFEYLVRKAE